MKNLVFKAKSNYRGYNQNPAGQIFYIHFFIDNPNANISLYTLSCPELKFRLYLHLKVVYAIIVSPFKSQLFSE